MPTACDEIAIDFGSVRNRFFKFFGFDVTDSTASLWDYTYDLAKTKFEGKTQPILGPDCRFTPFAFGCFAAPTGVGGPEGPTPWDHVVLRPGSDTFVYMDVGFWGGHRRDFGLVCGPHVWLCQFGQQRGAPAPINSTDAPSNALWSFYQFMGNFGVANYAVSSHAEQAADSTQIRLILPDMHMWPDPQGLCDRRHQFLRFWDFVAQPFSQLVALQHLENVPAMHKEEREHAFGSAGYDLVRLLSQVQCAREAGFEIEVTQLGDLFEMWAPIATLIDNLPLDPDHYLQSTEVAAENIPKWLQLVYQNPANQLALDLLLDPAMNCQHVYGNHDVYMATDWKSTGIEKIDCLKGSRAWLLKDLLRIEHGHRFQVNNSDGYWVAKDLFHPAGPDVTTKVNYWPYLRKFTDLVDNPQENLYCRNIPYASVWYLLAHHAEIEQDSKKTLFFKPPGFRIFCQGHTHNPELLKIHVSWRNVDAVFVSPDVPAKTAAAAAGQNVGAK